MTSEIHTQKLPSQIDHLPDPRQVGSQRQSFHCSEKTSDQEGANCSPSEPVHQKQWPYNAFPFAQRDKLGLRLKQQKAGQESHGHHERAVICLPATQTGQLPMAAARTRESSPMFVDKSSQNKLKNNLIFLTYAAMLREGRALALRSRARLHAKIGSPSYPAKQVAWTAGLTVSHQKVHVSLENTCVSPACSAGNKKALRAQRRRNLMLVQNGGQIQNTAAMLQQVFCKTRRFICPR